MLFNLSQQRCFPSQTGTAIGCYRVTGPWFSDGCYFELCAVNEPFNGENNCCSGAEWTGYNIPHDKDHKNMLTNKVDVYFTITELEVWEVKFIVI
jgi:hypothetical protein